MIKEPLPDTEYIFPAGFAVFSSISIGSAARNLLFRHPDMRDSAAGILKKKPPHFPSRLLPVMVPPKYFKSSYLTKIFLFNPSP